MPQYVLVVLPVILTLCLSLCLEPIAARAASATVVISALRTRGPNGGNDEFVELYNRSTTPVAISGWALRGSNVTGTSSTRAVLPPNTILHPGCFYLLTNANASGGPYSGPVSGDHTLSPGIPDDGGIGLVMPDGVMVDQVGMSTGAAFHEGTPLPSLTANDDRSYVRKPAGDASRSQDTDDNASDFTLLSPSVPHHAASPCVGGNVSTTPTGVGIVTPAAIASGGSTLLTLTVTPGANPPSTGLTVTGDLTPLGGSAAQSLFDDGTHGDVTAGDQVFSVQTTVASATPAGTTQLVIALADAQGRTGSVTLQLTVLTAEGSTHIHDIQGSRHVSPLVGTAVTAITGVVTATRPNGFYLQDREPDDNDATSEGLFVFTASPPRVAVGDAVSVNGTVAEYRPGGSASANLTLTELTAPVITVLSSGNPLPTPIVIGAGGRLPPTTVIEDDAAGDVETSGVFDPATDGLDFYETLEGMRVQVHDAVVVGPRTSAGEFVVLGDGGSHASLRTPRGGIVIQAADFNPERLIIDNALTPTPSVNVGDRLREPIIGILDYRAGNFTVLATDPLTVIPRNLDPETTAPAELGEVAIATFNVENRFSIIQVDSSGWGWPNRSRTRKRKRRKLVMP